MVSDDTIHTIFTLRDMKRRSRVKDSKRRFHLYLKRKRQAESERQQLNKRRNER